MLARRPAKAGATAFGHVNVDAAARNELQKIVQGVAAAVKGKKPVKFHPDDQAEPDEVLSTALKGFDSWFQEKAPWSLERVVAEMRATTMLPEALGATEIREGGWSFYAVRITQNNADAVIVRAKSPSYGLNSASKLVTRFVGTELKPISEPLIAFDHHADLLVVGRTVYVLEPRQVERLFVDADAVKARAPQTAATFSKKLGAGLSAPTLTAVQRVCSQNANVARRVERLIRDGALAKVTAKEVRAALPDAGLSASDFGKSGPLNASTDGHATILVDIAADLYYQPRFDSAPRRVAAYRKLR
jgi:hypothetical protein